MPKRTDIRKILIIGSGPIVIGQACEFDYSGTQACKAIREEGYEIVLLNSNPATIMTDPAMADRTYVEPITVEVLAKVIEAERPDALLATLDGQTALNVAVQAADAGLLDEFSVEMLGADYRAIQCAEDRDRFRSALQEIGIDIPRSRVAHSLEEAEATARELGFPCEATLRYCCTGPLGKGVWKILTRPATPVMPGTRSKRSPHRRSVGPAKDGRS